MFYRLKSLFHYTLHHFLGDWKYFLYDEGKHEKYVILKYYNQKTNCIPSKKTIIYIANGFCNHAGLCDRLKGITALYDWSMKFGIEFRIHHIHPFDLSNYLIPNQYDWTINEKEICYNRKWSSVNHLMLNNLVRKQIESNEIITLEKLWVHKRIKTQKKQMHFYTNMYPENEFVFGNCFQILFKPSPKLEKALNLHQEVIGGSYISISFRFVQLLGDFKDCDGITLSSEDQENLIIRSIEVIKKIRKNNPTIPKILITADSSTFLERARILPYAYIIEGRTGHINFENSDEVNMKTFLDFLMISKAQKVYLAKSFNMYNSDFARRAAMINNRPFELFKY